MGKNLKYIIYGIIALLVIIIIWKVFKRYGIFQTPTQKLIDTAETQADNMAVLNAGSPLTPDFYKKVQQSLKKGQHIKSLSTAQQIALTKKFDQAFESWGTDQNQIYDLLDSQIATQTQVSVMSAIYAKKGKSLKMIFDENLTESEKKKIMLIILSKPIGIVDSKGKTIK